MLSIKKVISIIILFNFIFSTIFITFAKGEDIRQDSQTQNNKLISMNTAVEEDKAVEQNSNFKIEESNIAINYRAILIGINNYPGTMNDLPFSLNEISSLKNTLLKSRNWNSSNIKTLTDSDATNVTLRNTIEWLDENEDYNDISIFYFVGHGGCDIDDNEYIKLFDSKISDVELDELLDCLEGKVIIVLDCCNSGGFIEELGQWKRVVLTACRKNEVAYQDYNLKSGIFGYFLNISLEKLTRTIETSFLFSYIFTVYYSKQLSQDNDGVYTMHPMIYDGTLGFQRIITRFPILPFTLRQPLPIKPLSEESKLWKL